MSDVRKVELYGNTYYFDSELGLLAALRSISKGGDHDIVDELHDSCTVAVITENNVVLKCNLSISCFDNLFTISD